MKTKLPKNVLEAVSILFSVKLEKELANDSCVSPVITYGEYDGIDVFVHQNGLIEFSNPGNNIYFEIKERK